MATNLVAQGNTITRTLTSGQTGYSAGDGYKVGNQVGVIGGITRDGQTVFSNQASAAGDIAIINLKGVFTMPKASGAMAQGARLYWDDTEKELTATAAGNTFAGFAFLAAASDDTTVQCNLSGGDGSGESGLSAAANVAVISTADGSDAGTTQTLANATKAKVNAILAALVTAGLMEAP